jgi:Tol biopolymer transport system component
MRSSTTWTFVTMLVIGGRSAAQPTTRVSVSTTGAQGSADSGPGDGRIASSADGRFVAFESLAGDLTPFDTNAASDVFVRDRVTNETTRISVSSAGLEGDADSWAPAISLDGRYVAFDSFASNLVPGDTNKAPDVFLHDRTTRTTLRIDVSSSGGQASGQTGPGHPAISGDGRYVAFASFSPTLVSNDTNGTGDVFVHDLQSGVTTVVSVDAAGAPGDLGSDSPSVSADGRFVAFSSLATNLVVGDTNTCSGSRGDPTHPCRDVFVRDRLVGLTVRVSVAPDGSEANGDSIIPALSGDGRFVVFQSYAENLSAADRPGSDVFVHDRQVGVTSLVSARASGEGADAPSAFPSVSFDGRFIVFESPAGNLCLGCSLGSTKVILRDQSSGEARLMSVDSDGAPANYGASKPSVSGDGRVVAFVSDATNLVPDDTNNATDVFVHDRTARVVARISPSSGSEAGGELVRIHGVWLPTAADTSVRFAGAEAVTVSLSSTTISVLTPAGSGVADLTIEGSGDSILVSGAYRYVAPELAARYGNVNLGRSDREDVLLVNASSGEADTRATTLRVSEQVSVVMLAPSSLGSASFALYGWRGVPLASTLRPQPRGIGTMIFPTPLNVGDASQPRLVVNNLDARLGAPNAPSSAAPTIVVRRTHGFPRPVDVSLQGFIRDDGSLIPRRISITNAVILHVVP